MKKTFIGLLLVLALTWVIGCVALYRVMRKPPEVFGQFMKRLPGPVAFLVFPFESLWTKARAGELRVGDAAPDFLLTKLDKTDSVQLSKLTAEGKPVCLIFGSYT